jgi:hypothetical protein
VSVAEELRHLRAEVRLLQEHVLRLQEAPPGAATTPPAGGRWSAGRLAVAGALTGGLAATVAVLSAAAWPGTLLAAALGGALPALLATARRHRRA